MLTNGRDILLSGVLRFGRCCLCFLVRLERVWCVDFRAPLAWAKYNFALR